MSRDRPEPAHGHGHGHGSRPGQEPARSRRPASMIQRLWRALAAFILLLTGAGALIYFGLQRQDQTIHLVVRRLQPLEAANLRVRSDFSTSQAILQAYILTGETRLISYYESARRDFTAAVARAHGLATGSARSNIALQRLEAIRWYGYADKMQLLVPGSASLVRLANESFGSASTFYLANQALHDRLAAQTSVAISTGQRDLDTAVAWSAGLAGLALLLGLAAAAGTVRGITRPLAGLTGTMRRLSAGDHTARAGLMGAAETRQVALSLNELADESDRLRAEEAETGRLLAATRAGGIRIREHLRADEVISEARQVLEEIIDADAVYLHLVGAGGGLAPPVGHEKGWLFQDDFARDFPGAALDSLRERFAAHANLVIQDVQGPAGDSITPGIRGPLRRAGVMALLLIPFGVNSDLLGFVVAVRLHAGHPWTPAEAAAAEWIATDLGRGLHHARLYEAENRLVAELKAVDQTKSDFLATVSHELRTPLTSIAGYLEIMRDLDAGPLTAAQARMLETVDRNTARLRHLIEDVLTLSRIESGAFKTAMMPVDLSDVISAAVSALRPAAARKEVSLSLSYAGSGSNLLVAGDPGQLDRVLTSLLSNAVKFTPEQGEIHVSVKTAGHMVEIGVSDTGLGIPARDQAELFTRFFRASNAVHRSIPGTGLGLAIVRTIIDNHGGEIAVQSQEGKGTTVTVRIPRLGFRGDTDSRQPMAEGEPPEPQWQPGRGGHGGPGQPGVTSGTAHRNERGWA